MKKEQKNILWSIAGCLVFLALPWIISVRPPEESPLLLTLPVLRDMITNAFILLLFFLNYYLFIPHLFFNRNYWTYGICIAFGFLIVSLLPSLVTGFIPWHMSFHGPAFHHHPPGQMNPGQMNPGQMNPGPTDPGQMNSAQTSPSQINPGQMSPRPMPPDSMPPGPTNGAPMGRIPTDGPPIPPGPLMAPPPMMSGYEPHSFLQEISHSIYLYITVILFSILLRVRSRLFLMQKEKVDAELSSLKTQINPHFLFNTLNSIYALAVKKDDKTADAVINLAGLMRYMIKEANGDRISLQKELDYLTNYVELQKARLRNTASVEFTIDGRAEGLEIAPLILITFVENAFKYGINPEMESRIYIAIQIKGEELILTVSNAKVLISSLDLSTGIGLDNTKSRLDLLYHREHRLDITEDKEHYNVYLSIHLI